MTHLAKVTPIDTRQPANMVDNPPGKARLDRAVISLHAVIVRQRRQVHTFRDTISELGGVVQQLEASLQDYRQALDQIDVKRLHRKARRLSRIMGGYLVTPR